MKKNRSLFFPVAILLLLAVVSGCYYDNEEYLYPASSSTCDTTNVTYSGVVSGIFSSNCNGCHSSSSPSGGVVTDNISGVKANITRIWGSINHTGTYQNMPQNMSKLSDCNLAKIRIWMNAGMPEN
jgi:hypothetical protein